jgi:hypothetical protein
MNHRFISAAHPARLVRTEFSGLDELAEFRKSVAPPIPIMKYLLNQGPQVDNGRVATDGVFDRDMSGALSLRTWRR